MECKLEADLVRLQETMPHRSVRGNDGGWSCPPGEQYARAFGFTYRVRSSTTIQWIFQRNLQFLADYLHPDCPPISDHVATAVATLVAQEPGILLADLLRQFPTVESDCLYTLIAQTRLYVDLHTVCLAERSASRS